MDAQDQNELVQAMASLLRARVQVFRIERADEQIDQLDQIQQQIDQPAEAAEAVVEEESKEVAQAPADIVDEPTTVLNPYTGRNIKIGGKAHQDMLRRLANERIPLPIQAEHNQNQVYQTGKTVITRFIDNGQFQLLKKDASEYTSDPVLQEFLTGYINQLGLLNVVTPSFNYEISKNKYIKRLPMPEQVQFDAQLMYECYQNSMGMINLNTREQFDEYFSCSICYKAFDAKTRIGNKSCSVCSFNACMQCYQKLQNNKQCPLKCKPNADSFVELPKHLFAQYQQLQFKCNKCNNLFNTADFQQHLSAEGNSICKQQVIFDCPSITCGVKGINKSQLTDHVKQCPNYETKCNHCYQMVPHRITQDHSCSVNAISTGKKFIDPFGVWMYDANTSFVIEQISGTFVHNTLQTMKDKIQAYIYDLTRQQVARNSIKSSQFLSDIMARAQTVMTYYKPFFINFVATGQQVSIKTQLTDVQTVVIKFAGGSITMYFR